MKIISYKNHYLLSDNNMVTELPPYPAEEWVTPAPAFLVFQAGYLSAPEIQKSTGTMRKARSPVSVGFNRLSSTV